MTVGLAGWLELLPIGLAANDPTDRFRALPPLMIDWRGVDVRGDASGPIGSDGLRKHPNPAGHGIQRRGMKLLVTGGAGFIGSNFVRYWLRDHPSDRIVNIDKLTHARKPPNPEGVAPRHQIVF